ncbi:GNAT family N-acetyltransferase [Streptomyces sp. NPDC017964]|uniref:GNAT family N-acetyltransferase n=1 Tax=Streptomyces sp. NPDC017964 TaxID=3365022 RepID=UPI003792C636
MTTVTARVGSRLCGFDTALRSADPTSPAQEQTSCERPVDALQITDLTVAPVARGRGVGASLLDVLLLSALDDRAWVSTDVLDRSALTFYQHRGWHQVSVSALAGSSRDGTQVVLLAPRHPAAQETAPLPRQVPFPNP